MISTKHIYFLLFALLVPTLAGAQSYPLIGTGPYQSVPENGPACPANMQWVPIPQPRPADAPPPRPLDPEPATTPTPEVTPTPKPTPDPNAPKPPPPPVPPVFPPEPADPESLGIDLLDQALQGKTSRHLLPYWHDYPWRKAERPLTWTRFLYDLLAGEGKDWVNVTPKDSELFCPNYANLTTEQKRIFWMRLFSVVMEQESTYRPFRAYHSVRVQFGLYSVGLMMLSLESSQQRRFGCDFVKSYDDLFDWRKNMNCSLRIMGSYYGEDGRITGNSTTSEEKGRWQGLSRYYEPFRDQRFKQDGGYAQVLKRVKQLRKRWLKDAAIPQHPSLRDEKFQAWGENEFERVVHLVNILPFCLTGAADEFMAQDPPPLTTPGGPYMCIPRVEE